MKVEESLVVLPSAQKRRQSYYLPRSDSKQQFRIDDYLLKKKRSSENQLINPQLSKKPKMIVNPFNKFSNFYLINSTSDHCSSSALNKIQQNKITNHSNTNHLHKINNLNNLNKCTNHLDSSNHANLLFNRKTGLPLSSSPIPQQKSSFNFERSIKSTNAIKRAILNKEPETDENFNLVVKKSGNRTPLYRNLLGSFEENMLNQRFKAVQTIFGKFRAEIGTYGKLYNNSYFCPDHLKMPVSVYFYNIHDSDNISASPYLAKVNLEKKGYLVPRKGNVQVTLFNPEDNVVKMFVVQYDLSDMPSNSQSFIRQKTYYMPKSFDCDSGGKTVAKPTDSFSLNSKLNSTSNENDSDENGSTNSTSTNSVANGSTKLNASNGFTKPTTSNGFTKPTTSNGSMKQTTLNGFTKSTTSNGSTKPTTSNGFTKPTTSNGFTKSNTSNGSTKSTTSNGSTKSSTSNGSTKPTTTNLTASLSSANLQTASTLPTNLTRSSKIIFTSKSTKNQPELCNVKFKSSWLRYLIHLRFLSTKSGKIYLHRNIRCLILRRNEFDPGNLVDGKPTYHWVTEQITEHANPTVE